MGFTLVAVIGILMVSLLLQKYLKFPSSMWMMLLGYIVHEVAGTAVIMPIDEQSFANLVLATIPILLMSDMMDMDPMDFKKHGYSLFFVIVIAMIGSLFLGYFASDIVFADYDLNTGEKIFTFIACFATDPVATIAIFSMFILPHGLKFIAEGESLGNDAIAILLAVEFALPLMVLEFTPMGFTINSIMAIITILVLGVIMAYIGLIMMGVKRNNTWDLAAWLMTAGLTFLIAENLYVIPNYLFGTHTHFHVSGIAVVIVAIMYLLIMTNRIRVKNSETIEKDKMYLENAGMNEKVYSKTAIHRAMSRLHRNISTEDDHNTIKGQIQFMALIANVLLFVYLGGIISEDWDIIVKYWEPIVLMVVFSTMIRGTMLGVFAYVSSKVERMINIPFHWWVVLTFAGFQGGLSVVFMTMLPADLANAELIRAVIIGNIVLSTLVNAVVLLWYITRNKIIFQSEHDAEHAHH